MRANGIRHGTDYCRVSSLQYIIMSKGETLDDVIINLIMRQVERDG